MKSKEHCDSTISCSALLLISGRKIKMYYQKCRKNDHLDINARYLKKNCYNEESTIEKTRYLYFYKRRIYYALRNLWRLNRNTS